MDHDRTSRSDPRNGGQRGHGLAGNATQCPARFGKDRLPNLNRRLTAPTGPDHDGEQLSAAESRRAEVDEAFPRPFRPGQLSNS